MVGVFADTFMPGGGVECGGGVQWSRWSVRFARTACYANNDWLLISDFMYIYEAKSSV